MKQHIEPTDLEKLTELGKERLRDWWKPRAMRGDLCYFRGTHGVNANCVILNNQDEFIVGYDAVPSAFVDVQVMKIPKDSFLPLLSMGQMIEFLEERDMRYVLGEWSNTDVFIEEEELCDALWESVREVLNEE